MRLAPFREMTMLKNFEEFQKYGKDHIDTTLKAWGQVSKNIQAIAAENLDYSKKSFEEGSAAIEKLLGAKSFEKAVEIQTAHAKNVYEGLVAYTTKLGELYTDLAKESQKPFETFVSKTTPIAK
jgi:phasin family protein